MFPHFRSRSARLASLFLLAPYLGGCTSTHYVPLGTGIEPAKITGVTTRAGQQLSFKPEGAIISRDTLYAMGVHGQVVIPTDSIREVWVRKFSAGRTTGLVVGIAVVIAGAVLIAYESSGGCCAP